jgi:hypothetical protein
LAGNFSDKRKSSHSAWTGLEGQGQDQDTQDQEKVSHQDQEKDKIPRKISIAYPLGGEGFSSTPSARWALGVEFWEFSWHGAGVLLESPFSDCSAHQKKRFV